MAKKRPMKLEDLFDLKAVGKVAMSPDGKRVAFEVKRADFEENKNFVQIMLAQVETGAVTPLTRPEKHNDAAPRWSPDGTRLAFLSDREKATCLYVLPMTGGEPVRLTEREGNVKDFNWSPDGRRLAYTYQPMNDRDKLERDEKSDELKKRPQFKHITRLIHKLDGQGYWNGHYTHVHVISAGGGKPRQLTSGDYDDHEPNFSPDGRLVSFMSNRSDDPDRWFDQTALYTVPVGGGRLRRLTPGPGNAVKHAWSPDGKWIAYIGAPHKPGEWWKYDQHVWVVDSRGGKPREVSRDLDCSCENETLGDVACTAFDTPPPAWSADSSRVYFVASEQGATRLYSRSIARKDTRCEVGGKLAVLWFQRTVPRGPLALSVGTATNPGDVYVTDPDEGVELRRLSDVNGDLLKRVAVVEPEEFWLKNGGTRLQCWVMKPPGFRANRKHPAILQIHGGPQAQYGFAFFHEMQLLAARGFVVAYTNPRGSAGYGLQHRRCIVGDWGNLDHKDMRKLSDWLFSRNYVDRKRVGVTGGSYGGFMTNWMIARDQRFAAAVTQRSCVNFVSIFGTSDYGFPLVMEMKGLPWKNQHNLLRQSPIMNVEKVRTPTLIIHSENDLRCPIEQAQQFFTALKYLGREVEYVAFEGESHGLSRGGRPQNRAERLRRIAGWFEKYCGNGKAKS